MTIALNKSLCMKKSWNSQFDEHLLLDLVETRQGSWLTWIEASFSFSSPEGPLPQQLSTHSITIESAQHLSMEESRVASKSQHAFPGTGASVCGVASRAHG